MFSHFNFKCFQQYPLAEGRYPIYACTQKRRTKMFPRSVTKEKN